MLKLLFIILFILFSCETENTSDIADLNVDPIEDPNPIDDTEDESSQSLRILALGDSYTAGTGVCLLCSYPNQLKDSLITNLNLSDDIDLNVIAAAGWTTTSLLASLNSVETENTYDLVTLLIGVNNQFQQLSFSVFENEFEDLISRAIAEGQSDKSNLIVISIPDYTYTPFGQSHGNPESNSEDIDSYNNYIEAYCNENDITFVYVTDISREGLNNPDLVADDNLHLSELAYALIVER